MKKAVSLILALLMMLSCLAACADDSESSSSEPSGQSSSESLSESESQPSFEGASSSEAESESESESESSDPADIVDPNAPTDVTLSLFENGTSDYVVKYDTGDEALGAYVDALVEHISQKYEITLEKRDIFGSESEHEIIIGSETGNAQYVVNKLYDVNDFAVSVCGDDLVLYATSERLYDYMFTVFEDIFDGERTTLEPSESFIYHKSKYKDMAYAGYLDDKNGSITYEVLKTLFEARTFTAQDGTTLPYRIYIPSSYDASSDFPVVTILHGAGERGSNNESQLLNMVPRLFSQENSLYWDAIVICPQCPSGQQWVDTPWANGNYSIQTVAESNELKAVLEILDSVEQELSTDENRFYVMGLSMGGFGTWDLIMRHKERFAAAIAMCGGADVSMAAELVDFPVYALHGGSDSVVPYKGTSDMISAMKTAAREAGVEEAFMFRPLAGYQHNIWDYVGDNATISSWMLEKNLASRASND